jgi:hypothetical protein
MKYLKKFNEELNPSTYRSAARGLLKQSSFNKDRADKLNKWADKVELTEAMSTWEENKKMFSKFGTINLQITNEKKFIGKFHLFINFDRDAFEEEFNEYREGEESNNFDMPLMFFIGAIPADQETLDNCLDNMPENDFGNGFFWTNVLSILMIFEGGHVKIHDIKMDEYDSACTGDVNIIDRAGAQTIKRIVYNMFSDPNYGYPSGYNDFDNFHEMFDAKILAECGLSSEYALSMEQVSDFLRTISANKFIG